MAKVTIDGKEYDTDKLPKEAVDLINSIVFVDTELQKLENQKKVLMAARIFYAEKLKEVLSKVEK